MDQYLSDAAHYPGGHTPQVLVPHVVGEIPDMVRRATTLLPIGAQSSLTAGVTPMGEMVLSTEKLTRIVEIGPSRITVESAVTVAALHDALASHGSWFPPAPTFTGAFAGGIVATNAAGAATFRHGTVRRWVEALTVIPADGSILTIHRGETRAQGGILRVPLDTGVVDVRVPTYRMPNVVKVSAGYYAAPDDGSD